MANILATLHSFGRPVAHWPLDHHAPGKAAQGGIDFDVAGTIGSASDPWASGTSLDLDGTTQDIDFAGLDQLVNGAGALTVLFWTNFDVFAGNQYVLFAQYSAGSEMTVYADSGGTVRGYLAAAAGDPGSGTPGRALASTEVGVWIPWILQATPALLGGMRFGRDMRTTGREENVYTPAYTNQQFALPTNQAMRLGGLGGRMNGKVSHLMMWDRIISPTALFDAIDTIDAAGVWCVVDPAEEFLIVVDPDVIPITAQSNLEYSLSDAVNGIVYASGANFTIASGDATTEMYVPAAGNYLLTLRDPSSGKAHTQTVALVAA